MSIELPPYRPVKKRSGLQVMFAAFHALLMRELQTRFGSFRLGYLWAPLEVLFQVIILMVIFGVMMERAVAGGMSYPLFLAAGLVPFSMLRGIATRSLGAVEGNKGLLIYNSLRHIDIIIARSFLELIIYFFSCLLIFAGLGFFGDLISLAHLDVFLFCWITLFLFSFGLALIMMVIGFYGGELSKIITIIFTILYFASGIIYPLEIVPEPYFSYLMYNPFIHNIELMRYSIAPDYPNYHINIFYFLKWMIAVLFAGLLMYKATEKDIVRSR